MEMQHCDAFDYWGKGTAVTVQSATAASVWPSLFPMVPCTSGSADTITIGCFARDFSPSSIDFKWTDASGTILTSVHDLPPSAQNNLYIGASFIQVQKSDWDLEKSYTCSVDHAGSTKNLQVQKKKPNNNKVDCNSAVTPAAPITMILNQPSPKSLFNNNQAELECVITGQDRTISDTEITWKIDGPNETSRIHETKKSVGSQHSKTSRMTLDYNEWRKVNGVRCSATSEHMRPLNQDLKVYKGGGEQLNLSVYALNSSTEVTLVCLVSSSVQQDYYIAWLEDGQTTGNYKDGINFPPQKIQDDFLVTSVYKTTKEKWKKSNMFYCNVWPAGSDRSVMKIQGVSEADDCPPESNLCFAVSCTEDPTEEDELSSLWSTTSFFIFLFIFSLFYNMIFSLVKMKKH